MDANSPLIVCVHCGTTNRVPGEKLALDPQCGRCGKAVLDGTPANLSDADFAKVVARTELPILVDFWATWCGPCVATAPQFEAAARQLKGEVLFVKVDSDRSPQASAQFAIRSIPTLIRFQGGRETKRQSGAIPSAQIVAFARG